MNLPAGFPKTLQHPSHQAAVLGMEFGQGRPERFPAVIVNTREQQEYYEAKGYREPGAASMYTFQEYPKWVDGVLVEAPQDAPVAKRKPGRPRKVVA